MADRFLTRSQAIERLERGDVIRMEIEAGARQWWFEAPLECVSDHVMQQIAFGVSPAVNLVEFGDSLFGLRMNSQSWQAARGTA